MTPSLLKIKLLGPVEILSDNQRLHVGRRIERAILYFLAAEHQPVSRTRLIDLLWSEADEIDHRGALRTALSRLRNELPSAETLATELDQVWLDAERCWVDSVFFQTSYESLKNILRAYHQDCILPAQIVSQIEETLALWRGDSLLQGENLTAYPEIEDWRRTLNRKLSHQRTTLMEKLANHYRASGRVELALELFLELGQRDLLDANFHLSVLELLMEMRRFQECVDYCDELELAYEREYNAPLPEPILKQYQYSQLQLQASIEAETRAWPIPLTMQLNLVGREKELEQLEKCLYRGGIIVIKGALGSGKTRLVQELFQSFQPRPTLFLAPSQEMEVSMPLSPIIHGFRQHVSQETWESLDCVWASKISLLLPELTEIREDCSGGQYLDAPTAKQQLFDAIHHVFQKITQNHHKILFFLDDAQWADKQTLEAVSYLIKKGFFKDHGLLIIASRKEEPNRELDEMIGRFHRTQTIQTIQLNGLSPSELGALVEQALDDPPSTGFLDKLYRKTNGNPFLALEILRNLLELPGEREKIASDAEIPLPGNVQAIIRARLNRLDESARQTLVCAAVIGNVFSVDLLRAGVPENTPFDLKHLDSLVQNGFVTTLEQDENQHQVLQFLHEIMRDVVLKEASPYQLRAIHQRVAAALAGTPRADEEAALIANHYLACGEIRSALTWLLKAADHAWALGAGEDTHRIYQQAESVYLKGTEDLFETEDVYQLYRQWGRFAYEADRIDLLEEIGFKLQYLGEQADNPLFLGISQMLLANACFLRLRMDTGMALINKAIDYLGQTDNVRAMMEAKLRQGAFHWWLCEYDETIGVCQEVLQIGDSHQASAHNLDDYVFFARHSISYSYYAKGQARKALDYATETYDQFFNKVSTFNRMRTLNMLANTNLRAANYGKAKAFAEEGLEVARLLENTFMEKIFLVTLSKTETIQGTLDQAYAHASKALKMGEKENHAHTIISANCVLGVIYRHLQNYNLALQHLRRAQLRGGLLDDLLYSIENDLELARTVSWMGQTNEARDLAQHALEVTDKHGMLHLHAMALLCLALCEILERNLPEAEAYISQAEPIAQENGLVFEQTWCKIGQARIALSRRQFDTAEEKIKAILTVSDQHNMAWMKLRGLNFCFQLYHATQKPSLIFCRAEYENLIKSLSENIRSDVLKQNFDSAKQYWSEGHAYP